MTQTYITKTMYGTHGTTKKNADLIEKSGFSGSQNGYVGSGVYFWSYINKDFSEHATQLAHAWCKFCQITGRATDSEWSIVYSVFNFDEKDILDLTNQESRELLMLFVEEYCTRNKITNQTKLDYLKVSEIHEAFIKEVEEKMNVGFKIVNTRISRPRHKDLNFKFKFNIRFVGYSECCAVVRDVNIINNYDFKEITL